jgi:hypothetical protein
MRKLTGILAFVLILLPSLVVAVPTGWFTIQKAYIEQLDADSCRLRVDVNFGGDVWDVMDSQGGVVGINPILQALRFDNLLGTSQYNHTINRTCCFGSSEPGNWFSDGFGFHAPAPLDLTGGFGYDFDFDGPILGPITIDYRSTVFWGDYIGIWGGIGDRPPDYTSMPMHTQNFDGSFTAEIVPEPGTLLLLGFGLAGGVPFAYRRRKRRK